MDKDSYYDNRMEFLSNMPYSVYYYDQNLKVKYTGKNYKELSQVLNYRYKDTYLSFQYSLYEWKFENCDEKQEYQRSLKEIQDMFKQISEFSNLETLLITIDRSRELKQEETQPILDALLKVSSSLKHFEILIMEGNEPIFQGLQTCKNLQTLRLTIQDQNRINKEGIIAIGKAIKNCSNIQELIVQIDKQNNQIGQEGKQSLEDEIKDLKKINKIEITIQ